MRDVIDPALDMKGLSSATTRRGIKGATTYQSVNNANNTHCLRDELINLKMTHTIRNNLSI